MSDALDRFRAAVMADPAIQQRLAAERDPAEFERIALVWAAERGLALAAADLEIALRPDPLGIGLIGGAPLTGAAWPPRQWLPLQVAFDPPFGVDWVHFAETPLTGSFFANTLVKVRGWPFNKLFRYRTPFDAFIDAPREGSVAPTGLIFHMSRCGSTLVAQMLAASPRNIVASEPEPLDRVIQLPLMGPSLPQDRHVAAFQAMAAAIGRDRTGASDRYFIKTDSWHALALPLFRAAFPDTPWVFLYRDPVEVLVSQMRMRGAQAAPGVLPPQIFGFEPDEAISDTDYTARVLARTCEAAIGCLALGGGMLVNYAELPEAVSNRILPHFGVTPDEAELAAMRKASRRDAKSDVTFKSDSEEKRREADAGVLVAAEKHLSGVYTRLEALRVA